MTFPLDRIRGSIPPLFTPFKDGAVDYDTYARMIEFQIKEGSHGILVNGTGWSALPWRLRKAACR
jgi:4-hydroxy-tetrahydrodipicolinate synthase